MSVLKNKRVEQLHKIEETIFNDTWDFLNKPKLRKYAMTADEICHSTDTAFNFYFEVIIEKNRIHQETKRFKSQ